MPNSATIDKGKLVPQGGCQFCSQMHTVQECYSQTEADEAASEQCNCPGAKEARNEVDAETRREQTLKEANEDITDYFGEGAKARGEIAVDPEVAKLFKAMAMHVYDERIRSVAISISQGVRAKISKTDKGKLIVQRTDNQTRKSEYGD